ncbi:nicotinate phosphoribosyltransferase [Aneurinibacillus migulanus]|uniref:nicotinate phosphoribosyltransferase n=1 Tax=Aneurinibacillus migulanus TaxID=47500 RepID=UPI0005BC4D01|nr:nicotinate phosphoribosyltransferase [Aneurinibacillus migulanus]KIV55142.1 nicotinate phosphoribosyltransferase [Aneurinibacillus migulanus]KPD06083.1 nicotinate phosphoribosyltransferase [Aneurinibacillus migulanus]CEH29564.1 Nicotinate phosphoribosyltransferase [Aneurinibacillus migulanus]
MKNLTMSTDLYQINMMYAYYKKGMDRQRTIFDVFFRKPPCGSGYAIFAGLDQVLNYIESIHFTEEDIAYLRSVYPYEEKFLEILRNFRFTGNIAAMKEGTVVFPGEPLIRVEAQVSEAQLIETAMLTMINHQTLIATKAARIVGAAKGDTVLEFGLRRAQGAEAGYYGARAAYIGGVHATSNVMAGRDFGIPVKGTHAHSFVQLFDNELDAFTAYSEAFPDETVLLVDTYDTLGIGIPHAIQLGLAMKEQGKRLLGIRLDSGDLAYLSKLARRMLDEAGLTDVAIVASSDLDERLIQDLKNQEAQITIWGVGTNLITSYDCPALGGVYKLAAVKKDGEWLPRLKISENPTKITNPGYKQVVRFYDRTSDKPLADLIALAEEDIPGDKITLFDPLFPHKRKTIRNYRVESLLQPVIEQGHRCYDTPSLESIRAYAQEQLTCFSPEIKRLINPHQYHVDLSQKLWDLKQSLIHQERE